MNESLPRIDHLGNEFPSSAAMARHYGIYRKTLLYRLSHDWTLERALTEKPDIRSGPCEDADGNVFASRKAMAEAHGTTTYAMDYRERQGADLAGSLVPPKRHVRKTKDASGHEHATLKAACAASGIPLDLYYRRVRRGWTPERALSTPSKAAGYGCEDAEGRKYPSLDALAEAEHIPASTLRNRVRAGMTPAEAVAAGPPDYGHGRRCTGPDGESYMSAKAMAKAYGAPYERVRALLSKGLSPEEAVLQAAAPSSPACHDHAGNPFPDIASMARAWEMDAGVVARRLRNGYDTEDALTVLPRGTRLPGMEILRRIEGMYYLIEERGVRRIMTSKEIMRRTRTQEGGGPA